MSSGCGGTAGPGPDCGAELGPKPWLNQPFFNVSIFFNLSTTDYERWYFIEGTNDLDNVIISKG